MRARVIEAVLPSNDDWLVLLLSDVDRYVYTMRRLNYQGHKEEKSSMIVEIKQAWLTYWWTARYLVFSLNTDIMTTIGHIDGKTNYPGADDRRNWWKVPVTAVLIENPHPHQKLSFHHNKMFSCPTLKTQFIWKKLTLQFLRKQERKLSKIFVF